MMEEEAITAIAGAERQRKALPYTPSPGALARVATAAELLGGAASEAVVAAAARSALARQQAAKRQAAKEEAVRWAASKNRRLRLLLRNLAEEEAAWQEAAAAQEAKKAAELELRKAAWEAAERRKAAEEEAVRKAEHEAATAAAAKVAEEEALASRTMLPNAYMAALAEATAAAELAEQAIIEAERAERQSVDAAAAAEMAEEAARLAMEETERCRPSAVNPKDEAPRFYPPLLTRRARLAAIAQAEVQAEAARRAAIAQAEAEAEGEGEAEANAEAAMEVSRRELRLRTHRAEHGASLEEKTIEARSAQSAAAEAKAKHQRLLKDLGATPSPPEGKAQVDAPALGSSAEVYAALEAALELADPQQVARCLLRADEESVLLPRHLKERVEALITATEFRVRGGEEEVTRTPTKLLRGDQAPAAEFERVEERRHLDKEAGLKAKRAEPEATAAAQKAAA